MPPSPIPRSFRSRYNPGPMQAVTPKPAAIVAAKTMPPKALKITGNPELWQTLQKVTDPNSGWTKTTRAMQVPGGVLINTCSRKTGAPIAAEALVMVPGCHLMRDTAKGWLIA